MKTYGVTPKKSLGQVFLISDGHIQRMVEAIDPSNGDFIVEVGPGLGALTRHLAAAAEVVGFEIDQKFCDILNTELRHAKILHRDFLEVDLGLFVDAYLGGVKRPVKICGNLPYNISSQILVRISTTDTLYRHAHFLVQKEVGAKVSGSPGEGEYGRISAMVQTFCNIERLFDVPAGAFLPKPEVDSTFLRLKHRQDHLIIHSDIPTYGAFIKASFSQKRKSLFNNLRRALGLTEEKELVALLDDLAAVGADRLTRPEELSPDEFARLFLRLKARVLPDDEDLPI